MQSENLIISEIFAPAIELLSIGDFHVVGTFSTDKISIINSFDDNVSGIINTRNVSREFRVSTDNIVWTDWFLIEDEDIGYDDLTPAKDFYIELRWIRIGSNANGIISINSYNLNLQLDIPVSEDHDAVFTLLPGSSITYKPPYVYKAFRIDDFGVYTSTGECDCDDDLEIKYRISQDSGRTWTQYEHLTKENISTIRINPIRFFLIEYCFTNNSSSNIRIHDLSLIGDFQNVTLDYLKTNLLGIRECCGSDGDNMNSNLDMQDNCSLPENLANPMSDDKKNLLFSPYSTNKALELFNSLANSTTEVFGHEVVYFVTDPDKNGTDFTFHEYQLYNYTCEGLIKVMVEGNQFPDNQITFNQFDLSLFETFEIHITKDMFKQVFGVDKRPSKEDFLWFCTLNRMFIVEHSQQFRNFNNAAVYYKIMLKKYNQKANVKAANTSIEETVRNLTKNSTLDELFGIEKEKDKKSIANKDQFKPLTKDPIRLALNAKTNRELLDNGPNVISKNNYDLMSVPFGATAVSYVNGDNYVRKGDNRAFSMWFNINNYTVNDTYHFINNYDFINNKGYKITLENGLIDLTINGVTSSLDVSKYMDESIWFCYLANIDQRQRKVDQYLYRRSDKNVVIESVDIATTGDISLNGIVDSTLTDGYTVRIGDRVLVKDQANPIENGVYEVGLTAWGRTNTINKVPSLLLEPGVNILVANGASYGTSGFVITGTAGVSGYIESGVDPIHWAQNSGTTMKVPFSTILKLVKSSSSMIDPVEFELEGIDTAIFGSDMKMTSIRLYNDIIPIDKHSKILNQSIIRDSQFLIFADDANNRLVLPNYPIGANDSN